MDSQHPWVVPLSEATDRSEDSIGGKAEKLVRARSAGLLVPRGFCVTSGAYEEFLALSGLAKCIAMELGRKPLETMRWEEIWDTALRIRSEFLHSDIPEAVSEAIVQAAMEIGPGPFAVRSSAVGEDSGGCSFAGLHESVIGVVGTEAVLDAVRRVWASLWSDAALLYRSELSLDPIGSRMAVLVQQMIDEDRSGVAFGRDPRNMQAECAIVEAVPGRCSLLVDGAVDPDRWILSRSSGEVVQWRRGVRDEGKADPLLRPKDLDGVLNLLRSIESLFGWPPDVEWTGSSDRLTLLQARPITTAEPNKDDKRSWYLSLRPGTRRLKVLADRVSKELIPELEKQGRRFAAEDLTGYGDEELTDAIEHRLKTLHRWRKVYWDEFIPLAHGVRRLAQYYNDAVRPDDPYEFVGLLKGMNMLASRRNLAFAKLATRLHTNRTLMNRLVTLVAQEGSTTEADWLQNLDPLRELSGGDDFLEELQRLMDDHMDVTMGSQRLSDRPSFLANLIEMAQCAQAHAQDLTAAEDQERERLQIRLFEAVGAARKDEATEVLRIGRLSWRLRDDDNLLLSRIESQLYRAAELAMERLRRSGRLLGESNCDEEAVPTLIAAMRDRSQATVELPSSETSAVTTSRSSTVTTRQLVGQPAAPGLATGSVRRILSPAGFAEVRTGEVLVCDAIQPMMTHLVPLAAAIIERRGGMLIHGAIIARELGIPCVNGIVDAVERLADGDFVTVDGHLGIVTVGPPEFDLELEGAFREKT